MGSLPFSCNRHCWINPPYIFFPSSFDLSKLEGQGRKHWKQELCMSQEMVVCLEIYSVCRLNAWFDSTF